MIYVIASIKVKADKREEFLKIFNANVANVLAEKGCIAYSPCVDVDTPSPIQEKSSDTVTIVEAWDSVDALNAHLATPHMKAYGEATKDLRISTSLKILSPVK